MPTQAAGCNCPQSVPAPARQALVQEPQRCGCPIPAPATPCANAVPVTTSGCGCQPVNCNPVEPVKEEIVLPKPTKVLSVQCFDITTYTTTTHTSSRPRREFRTVTKYRNKQVPKTTYKKVEAIRYKMKKVTEMQKKKVPKIDYKESWTTEDV